MEPSLLHYRPWRGSLHAPRWSVWPIARIGLAVMLRRKIFWGLYALGLVFFCMFFFGQYLLAYAETQNLPRFLLLQSRRGLHLDGSGMMYAIFFRFQASMVIIILALAGSVLVGNDFQYGSLPFYLSKPLGRWHYLLGKFLGLAVFINLMTTIPAIVLYLQFGMLENWDYADIVLPILAYGLMLTVFFGLLVLAVATWLRRTIPFIMAWATLFFFLRQLAFALVNGLDYDARWRLLDLWNDTVLVGNRLLGIEHDMIWPQPQPPTVEAVLVLGVITVACAIYLNLRIRAVEVVR
jgi:ABC-type transport system involved in multi-copper enzyme maturation permease subunit